MSLAAPRPRVTSSMLGDFIGSTVCLAGQVVEVDQVSRQWARIQTGEGTQVQCRVTLGDEFELVDGFVEVLGTVADKNSIDMQFYASLGNDFDLGAYDEAVRLSAQYPELFPQRSM
ncbi:replication protein A 14 kDa subunit-like [Sycon ciliatum]|uniref:replication protein A 14 kDa subunit-like n=1 Tax=Sycon ciliatum TaxID=27933 RepID=UPI0020A902BA|eukprot:scpid103744/ scgid27310/ Replication protein A 14 kDa subunit; Replication factor A protein 3